MFFKRVPVYLIFLLTLAVTTQYLSAQSITGNRVGSHGGYTYEYWKDGGTGSMELKDGGAFSCTWSLGGRQNILFRKGIRPGSKTIQIAYTATYKPTGNSYLSCYGWTKNPLIEYYIVESWGTWRPPGGSAKGTVSSDGGTYDIYQTTRTNAASIEGTRTFQQYWSVRRDKKTKDSNTCTGVITCANHFNAWASAGMQMGNFYEVAFKVEGYDTQNGGSADVTMMSMSTVGINASEGSNGGRYGITMAPPVSSLMPTPIYNVLGQKNAEFSGSSEYKVQNGVIINSSSRASGAYYSFPCGK